MPASIGVNLRVTGHCRQGGRKYMEDFFSVAYQQTEDEKDLEYAFFGIYDGHGGAEAAAFAKEHLMETIIKHKNFWSDNDEDVLRAIKDGYIATHYAMWKEQEKWPRTASGLPSTAGTTASVAFIRRGKIYIGHVGDSGIILGYQDSDSPEWKAMPLTRDHKPENADEMSRIEQCGGKVVAKSGVPRVVWNRPKIGHQGPVRRSTPIDEIPFLAVARSLGDLWSYNSQINQFVVSPDPDCSVIQIDPNVHRCLVFGTDGLYNMLSPSMAVHIVQNAEIHNEMAALPDATYKTWLNPSKLLVEKALERWHATKMRADNTSVVTLMLDPPGPPRAQVLKDRKKNAYPDRGLKIMTRYEDNQENCSNCLRNSQQSEETNAKTTLENVRPPSPVNNSDENKANNNNKDSPQRNNLPSCATTENTSVSSSDITTNYPLKERNFVPKPRESTSFDPREPKPSAVDSDKENLESSQNPGDNTIQIHEISSSSSDMDHCDDENSENTSRHNLRSAKKLKPELKLASEPGEKLKVKRKLPSDDSAPQKRKSIRIDIIQKKALQTVENQKKTSETSVQRISVSASPQQLSLTQKILKSKKLDLKKKSILKGQLTKTKIKLVIESVKKFQKSALPSKINKSKTVVAKTPKKKLAENKRSKIGHFQRRSKANVSQSQRKVLAKAIDKKKKLSLSKNKISQKKEVASVETSVVTRKNNSPSRNDLVVPGSSKTSKTVKEELKRNKRSSEIKPSTKNGKNSSSPKNSPTKPPPKSSSVKVKTIKLKKKLQQKTAKLRKNVVKRK